MTTPKISALIAFLSIIASACSSAEDINAHYDVTGPKHTSESGFLAAAEEPGVIVFRQYEKEAELSVTAKRRAADLMTDSEEDIFVRLINATEDSVDNWVAESPGETPKVIQIFHTTVCDNNTLVLVIEQGVNTAASVGKRYFNALFDPTLGEWITTFYGAETKDRDTGETIVDNQSSIMSRLIHGVTANCPEILDPRLTSNETGLRLLLEKN